MLYLAVFAAKPVVTLNQAFRHSETSLDLVHVIKQRRRHADLSSAHGHINVRRAEQRTDIIGWFRAIERDNRRPVLWRSEQPMTCFTRPSFRCRASATCGSRFGRHRRFPDMPSLLVAAPPLRMPGWCLQATLRPCRPYGAKWQLPEPVFGTVPRRRTLVRVARDSLGVPCDFSERHL